MPYIKPNDRPELTPFCSEYAGTAGELNYQFTHLAQEYIKANGLSYQNINDVVGALEGAKVEFQRRVVAPYEDAKIKENGDVY